MVAACGKQVESRKPEAARMIFGTSDRVSLFAASVAHQ